MEGRLYLDKIKPTVDLLIAANDWILDNAIVTDQCLFPK